MIRVCHIITGLAADGAERMLWNLVTRMDRGAFRNEVISLTTPGDLGPALEAAGIPVQALGLSKRPGALVRLAGLRRRLRASRPDIVQTWMYHADLLGGLMAHSAGVRRVFWGIHHASLDRRTDKWATLATARACALLSGAVPWRILCCSEATRVSHARFGYREGRTELVPNGFDTGLFRPDAAARQQQRAEWGATEADVVIGLAARFHPHKDHANFLAAAQLVAAQHPQALFVLCGRGIDEQNAELQALCQRYLPGGQVRLLGAIAQPQHFFAALDVAVSSSRTEAFPLAVGEAMACGVPCVVTAVGDSARLVGAGGVAVPPGDPAALARALGELVVGGPELRARLGVAARARIEGEFSLPATVERYQDLYRRSLVH